MAYSLDFRKKVLSYCKRTGSITEASDVFQISRNTIYGWLKLKEKTGHLNHQVKGTKPRKVDRDSLKNYLMDHPYVYLTEIASEFDCHPTTIHYALKAMGYTRKKKNSTYYEQDPEKVALFLNNFNSLKHLTPVYIDETGFDTYFYREYGRSLRGQLIKGKVFGKRYQRISLVAGLINGEIIAPMIDEETMTSEFFEAWFQKFLLPTLGTPSVIIMDHARFHRMSKLERLCEEYGHKLLPLSPYFPEYNPIKKTWAYIKKHLKKVLPNYNNFYEVLFVLSLFQLIINLKKCYNCFIIKNMVRRYVS